MPRQPVSLHGFVPVSVRNAVEYAAHDAFVRAFRAVNHDKSDEFFQTVVNYAAEVGRFEAGFLALFQHKSSLGKKMSERTFVKLLYTRDARRSRPEKQPSAVVKRYVGSIRAQKFFQLVGKPRRRDFVRRRQTARAPFQRAVNRATPRMDSEIRPTLRFRHAAVRPRVDFLQRPDKGRRFQSSAVRIRVTIRYVKPVLGLQQQHCDGLSVVFAQRRGVGSDAHAVFHKRG